MTMYEVLKSFPEQFAKGLELARGFKLEGRFDSVIISGMGGSALPGELVKAYLYDLKIPIHINRDYFLPSFANNKSFIVVCSYSGNTEETLSVFEECIKRDLNFVVVASGGRLETLCRQKKIHCIKIPSGIQPRCATGYFFSSIIGLLSNSGIIPDKKKEIIRMAGFIKSLDLETEGKTLAKRLVGKIPVVYASEKYKPVAMIWKIKFNENSKAMAFYNCFPELNHNEMNGYVKSGLQGRFFNIILRDSNDNSMVNKRMDITSGIIKSAGGESEIIDMRGKSTLDKMFSALYLGDWVSYYLALGYGVDPEKVELVERLKKMIAK